jgi:hypothetical protein
MTAEFRSTGASTHSTNSSRLGPRSLELDCAIELGHRGGDVSFILHEVIDWSCDSITIHVYLLISFTIVACMHMCVMHLELDVINPHRPLHPPQGARCHLPTPTTVWPRCHLLEHHSVAAHLYSLLNNVGDLRSKLPPPFPLPWVASPRWATHGEPCPPPTPQIGLPIALRPVPLTVDPRWISVGRHYPGAMGWGLPYLGWWATSPGRSGQFGWAGRFRPTSTVVFLFSEGFNLNNSIRFQTSKFYRNSNKFDKNINSIPLFEFKHNI